MKRLLLLLVLLTGFADAQTSVKVTFANEAPRVVWAAKSPTEAPPSVPTSSARSVTVEKVPPGGFICVVEETSGNMAVWKATAKSAWTVAEKDFSRAAQVKVRFDPGGTAVDHAAITLGETKLVDAGSRLEATFYGVPLGPARVSVSFKVAGADRTQAQRVELDRERTDKVPTLVVALSGQAGSTGQPPKQPTDSKASIPEGSLIGRLVLILLVAVGAIAGLIFGLKWIYSNQDKTKDALSKVGVQIPDPVDPDPVAPPPPVVAAQAPQQIVLPDAAPTVMAAPLAAVGEPRLIGSNGVFELLEGVHVIGREAGLTIALVGESTVSRRHAELVRNGDSIILRDLGSTNGTFVNGVRLSGDQSVRRGDAVQFGSVQFRIE